MYKNALYLIRYCKNILWPQCIFVRIFTLNSLAESYLSICVCSEVSIMITRKRKWIFHLRSVGRNESRFQKNSFREVPEWEVFLWLMWPECLWVENATQRIPTLWLERSCSRNWIRSLYDHTSLAENLKEKVSRTERFSITWLVWGVCCG